MHLRPISVSKDKRESRAAAQNKQQLWRQANAALIVMFQLRRLQFISLMADSFDCLHPSLPAKQLRSALIKRYIIQTAAQPN